MQVTKFNLVTDLKIMLSNVTHSHFYCECNKERGPIDQLYIELGVYVFHLWIVIHRYYSELFNLFLPIFSIALEQRNPEYRIQIFQHRFFYGKKPKIHHY